MNRLPRHRDVVRESGSKKTNGGGGNQRANEIAQQTLDEVRTAMGTT